VPSRLSEEVEETDVAEEGHIAFVANVVLQRNALDHRSHGGSLGRRQMPALNAIVFANGVTATFHSPSPAFENATTLSAGGWTIVSICRASFS
jgi:hypothetical protein